MLSYLFPDTKKTYSYHVPKEIIRERINAIFNKSGKFLSEPDFDGCFVNEDNFEMSVHSGALMRPANARFGSVLYGKIKGVDDNKAIVETIIKVQFPIKFIAIVSSLIGLGFLYQFINEPSIYNFLWASAMLVLAPVMCNRFAGVLNQIIQTRFERYIHPEIKKMNTPDIAI